MHVSSFFFFFTVFTNLSPSVPGPSKAVKKQKAPTPKTSKMTVTKSYHRTDEQISLQLETFR